MENHAEAGQKSLHLQDSAVAGVLAYTIQHKSGVCGTTIGADGSGDFAIVIYGSPFDAHEKAKNHLKLIEMQGFTVKNYIFVPQIECYSGMPIKDADMQDTPILSATLRRLDDCAELLREEFEQKQDALLRIRELESMLITNGGA